LPLTTGEFAMLKAWCATLSLCRAKSWPCWPVAANEPFDRSLDVQVSACAS
jgi:hypothetical protein